MPYRPTINVFLIFLVSLCVLYSAIAAYDSASTEQVSQLRITRITPSGEDVPAGRQIVIQFNRPVVPIGRMDRDASEIPIAIDPQLQCQWRWLSTSVLACQLNDENALKQSTRYEIHIEPGLKAEDGSTIQGPYDHMFITERPKVRYPRFRTWQRPGSPVIQLTFNQPVSKSSVARYIYVEEPYGTKRYRLFVKADEHDRQPPSYIVVPGEPLFLYFGKQKKQKSDDDPRKVAGEEARRIWLVSPEGPLPLDTSFLLKVEPGLVSAMGAERSVVARTLVEFDTFPEFRFMGVRCVSNTGHKLLITKTNAEWVGKCNPLVKASLSFSSPVLRSQVKANITFKPDLAGGRTDYDPWATQMDYSSLRRAHKKGRTYQVRLPEVLKAAESYQIKSIATMPGQVDLQDEFGRHLLEPIDLKFYTDHRRPNFHIVHNTAVLEGQIDTEVPLHVTNLDEIRFDYKQLTTSGGKENLSRYISIPKAKDVQFAIPFEVRKMLQGKSGVVYGHVSTKPHVQKHEYAHILFAQVSPYQVHVKLGHFNTFVWVTDLATGKPVKDAKVVIYKDAIKQLSANFKALDKAATDDEGIARLKGTNELEPKLQTFRCYRDDCEKLFIRIDKDSKMALMPLARRFEIYPYRVSNYAVHSNNRKEYGHIHTWGTTAQGVYRVGDTVQYKFYVRNQDNETYTRPPQQGYKLEIIDPKGNTVEEIKALSLSKFGSFNGEYTIPKNGAVGWYRFKLSADFTDYTWQPMRVLVSDFTPSPFKVQNSLNGDLFKPGQSVEVFSHAKLHSGGAYTDAQVRITARLKAQYFYSEHPLATGFSFDSYTYQSDKNIFQKIAMLNDKGEFSSSFTIPKENIVYGQLRVESAVLDDRGKYIAASSVADYIAVNRLVGLKNTKWLYKEDKPAQIKYIVVDERGEPAVGTKVEIKIDRKETKAVRIKGAGNAYLTNFVHKWVEAGTCKGTSSNAPQLCEFTPEEPGSHRIKASIEDTEGNPHSTEIYAWVAGKGRVVWQQPNDNSLQIVPEKTTYQIGDTARYLIKNPFPGAQALVSIERYGVIKHWVQTLEGSTPVISFKVEKDFMPGFYLSVVVTSPRVEKPLGEGNVDLGKPSFKMGYVKVLVKDPYKEITVTVKTDTKVYKPRDLVTATIHATPRHKDRREPIEIAVAVLDEAVLDLVQGGKTYYDPYSGFYHLDGLDLSNYSLITKLLGRQKFEKKGASPGGDGGSAISMRSLFKFVSYWNPSIKPDKNGMAKIQFNVPDNLTGWRVLALAVTPTDRMGLGDTNFKVNRPTELRPVMPNQVTEGDEFKAGFSVMNRTDKPRDIRVKITAKGNIKTAKGKEVFEQSVSLAPYKRTTVWMPIVTGAVEQDRNILAGSILFTATAVDKIDSDGIKHSLPVNKRRSLETAANYGTTLQDSVTESLKFPKAIYPDVGEVSVVLSPSVIGNVEGAFRYMQHYPYICWEQILTKGVMAAHYQRLKSYMPEDFKWRHSEVLPQDILNQAVNFQAPNGGMTYYIALDRYVSPFLSAYTALAFNWLRAGGYSIPEKVEDKLHTYLKKLLKKDVFPGFYSKGMSSTVRAVALAALSKHGKISHSDLQRYRSHVPYMSLFGKAHYLLASLNVGGSQTITQEVTDAVLAHASQSGGKFSFNETLDDSYTRILATPLRANCAILSSLTQYGETSEGANKVGDVPFKLVRTITQTRGNRDHWENTQENMFCMNALIEYSRVYENIKPNMDIAVNIDSESMGKTDFDDLRDEAVTLSRSIKEDDVGKHKIVTINREGQGRLYYATRMRFAPLDDKAIRINAGIDIRKEYSVERNGKWILLQNPAHIKRSELVQVDIYVSLPTARNFVVVDDPVPGGLEPINRDLANVSVVDADKGKFKVSGGSWWFQFSDWHYYNVSRWNFYHKELRHDAVRFYSDYLPAGNYHLSYTAQAIAEGDFTKMPVHAEEMYDPDIFGKGLPGTLQVTDE